jgi:O-antigen/teichoic acid export membrane protein
MFSAWILPASLITTYDGILVYRSRLRDQAIIRMTGESLGLVVAIGGLLAGYGVFSLVASRLTAQLINLSGCIIVVRWLPSFNLRRPFTAELFEFSRHILASRLVTFFRSYSATLAVGSFLGMAEAGYFRAAERIVAAFSELLGDPARMIGWIVFRRAMEREKADDSKAHITQAGNTILTLLLAIAAPVYLGLPLVSEGLVHFALGPEWQPAAIVICILSIKQLLLIPSYVTEPLLAVTGNVRHIPPISFFNGAVSVILIVALSPFGLVPVALGQSLAAVVALATTIWLQSRYGRLNWPQVLRHSAFIIIAIAAMVAAVYGLTAIASRREFAPALTMALQILVGVVIYCGAMAALKPATVRSFWLLRKG